MIKKNFTQTTNKKAQQFYYFACDRAPIKIHKPAALFMNSTLFM